MSLIAAAVSAVAAPLAVAGAVHLAVVRRRSARAAQDDAVLVTWFSGRSARDALRELPNASSAVQCVPPPDGCGRLFDELEAAEQWRCTHGGAHAWAAFTPAEVDDAS